MPISRSLRRRSRPSSPRTLAGSRLPVQLVDHLPSEEEVHRMHQCLEAGAKGDAARALGHYLASTPLRGGPVEARLREMAALGTDAPGWVYSRWVVDQAYLWMLVEEDGRVDAAVGDLLDTVHRGLVPEAELDQLDSVAAIIAAGDRLCRQLAVYDYDGLTDYLDEMASPFLLRRADRVEDWARVGMGAFRIVDRVEGRLVVEDLLTGAVREALDLGALVDRSPGVTVVGRLVPVSAGPGWMFESRPLEVDARTARALARRGMEEGPDAWLDGLGEAVAKRRLAPYFSFEGPTRLTTDLVSAPGGCPQRDEQSAAVRGGARTR